MKGNVMTHHASALSSHWEPVHRFLFTTLAYGLSLLLAAPFFLVLFAPFYMGKF